MIETAIILPLVLVAIFVAIGLAAIANGRSALSSAMTEAIRLAATRGDQALMGGEQMISPVESYRSGDDLSILKPLLSSGEVKDEDFKLFLNDCFGRIHGTTSLKELPPQYIYSLVFINQALQQSIGPSLKFPCIPPGGSPPGAGGACPIERSAGCVSCYLINPDTFDFTAASADPDPNRYAIRCEYSPSSVFLDPIYRIFSVFSSNGASGGAALVIKRDRLFEITRLGG
jgi:hypothetical protein